eukprot:NODE_44_length_28780_cov_0.148496.p7 type:complete len:346 gc:universal NODE_44_length_28780_cov_0.148496:26556-27593(+)
MLRRCYSFISPLMGLNKDQQEIYHLAHQFGTKKLKPYMQELDEKQQDLPHGVFKEAAELGFGGVYVSEKHGGTGLNRISASIIFEALSESDVSTTAYLSIHNMVAFMVDRFGNNDQKSRYLADLCSMKLLSSYCLTEPGSGSDAASLSTSAVEKDSYYLLNGTKAFISGAGQSDLYLVMAKSGTKDISCFIVEKGTEGLSFGKKEVKLGWNSQPTRSVILENCKVPKENLLGKIGQGFKIAMQGLDGGRLNIASCSLGGAIGSFNDTIEYIKNRKQFGKRIIDFQYTQFQLAEMAANLNASRLLVRHAAQELDNKSSNATPLCASAKMFATDKCFDIVNQWYVLN